jgi:adenylate kinase family enzyme
VGSQKKCDSKQIIPQRCPEPDQKMSQGNIGGLFSLPRRYGIVVVVCSTKSAAAPSRILFYGVTGSGKSSAAHAYSARTGLPEFSADDDIGWLPGWEQRSEEEQREIAASIASQDQWVLDSSYRGWRDIVLSRAELVVALDYPRWLSLVRLLRRSVLRALTGQMVCNGNTESLGRLFTKDSIVRWHFQSFRRKRRAIKNMQADPDMPPVLVFRHPRDVKAWMSHR